jgi:feruloyl esterase
MDRSAARVLRASALGLAACLLAAPASALTRAECVAFGTLTLPDTTLTSARFIPASAGLPAHCQLLGTLEAEIRFELRLPATSWNQKLYHQGGGGFVGQIPSALPALGRGYATVATDTGHASTSALDASWALDRPDRQLNWAHRAVHLVTLTAQQIVSAVYGRPPLHAYFQGCSNGGRQALMEAQRYPTDYDGIIAGAPALAWTGTNLAYSFDQQVLADAEPITPAQLARLAAAVLARCDTKDRLRDGLIDDPARCHFDPAVLECGRDVAADCLTHAQVEALRQIYAGPETAPGRPLHPGYPPGHEDGAGGWQKWITGPSDFGAPFQLFINAGFLRFFVFSDPDYDPLSFDLERDRARLEPWEELLDATDPDLSAFRRAGGKLILWHGWADPSITAYRTLQYYRAVRRKLHRPRQADDFVRLFFAAGMHHCEGGPGLNQFDALSALEQWVEVDVAPDAILAEHVGSGVPRTRPLCAYPKVAVLERGADPDVAESFTCKRRGPGHSRNAHDHDPGH